MAVQYAFGKIITQGLDLNVDAADPTSYPGSGTAWTSVVNRSITGSLVSCSYSTDFKGGIVFNNPSASVVFPGTLANYGTGSFTVEMAFRPTQIQGIHYLVSKNSGSFPNWGVYLSGSGGQGKLFAEYRINASVSCSVSSSTTITTSSAYQTDVAFNPITTTITIGLDGAYDAVSSRGNGTGSLGTTGSLLVGNLAPSSSNAYSGSILNIKIYSIETSGYSNYKTLTPRFSKPIPNRPPKMQVLVVAGGGAGNAKYGGGGAGGLRYVFADTTPGVYDVYVGAGGVGSTNNLIRGNNGQDSFLGSIIATGGGGGGGSSIGFRDGAPGGSGGGGAVTPNTGSGNIPNTVPAQGNDGGRGGDGTAGAGGGGGAGQKGFDAGTNPGGRSGGNGGAGLAFSITGNTTYYAGGGGGGSSGPAEGGQALSTGGIGGGGDGRSGLSPDKTGGTGSANTGGGGGAGYNALGGAGGSGIVIIRYPGGPIASGGTITQVAGDTIHTFTATGSHTFTIF